MYGFRGDVLAGWTSYLLHRLRIWNGEQLRG